jgi:hypothetical protein
LRRAARGIAIRRAAAGRDGDARSRGTGWDHPGGGAGATPSAACATHRSEISSLVVLSRRTDVSDGRGRPPVARRLSKERSQGKRSSPSEERYFFRSLCKEVDSPAFGYTIVTAVPGVGRYGVWSDHVARWHEQGHYWYW